MKRQLYVLPKDRQLAAKEIQMLSSLRHPNIVAYHEAFVSEQFIFIVMQYCDGGDLDQLLKAARQRGQRLNERFIIRCFLQARLQPRTAFDLEAERPSGECRYVLPSNFCIGTRFCTVT